MEDGSIKVCMVKLCRNQESAAACISELVSTLALKSGGSIQTLDPVLVRVSDDIYSQFIDQANGAVLNVGVHYGTIFEDGVDPGPVSINNDHLMDWVETINLYFYDVWLKNIDRFVLGNVLLRPFAGHLRIVAADQSDCFGGVGTLPMGLETVRKARVLPQLCVADESGAVVPIGRVAGKCKNKLRKIFEVAQDQCIKMASTVDSILRKVPEGWVDVAGFDPSFLSEFLTERAENLGTYAGIDLLAPDESLLKGALELRTEDET